jgi:hypothetical protein
MITEEMLTDLFDRTRTLRREGKAKWDIDDVCRWSFFFLDSSRDKLIQAAVELEKLDYEIIGFLEPSPEDDDQETIFLRVDRVERHTVSSLLRRNDELYSFAARLGLAAYDGMDCGAVDGP